MKARIKAILKGAALGLTLVAIAIKLSSCGIPLKATYIGEYGAYSYSAKSGIEIHIRADK